MKFYIIEPNVFHVCCLASIIDYTDGFPHIASYFTISPLNAVQANKCNFILQVNGCSPFSKTSFSISQHHSQLSHLKRMLCRIFFNFNQKHGVSKSIANVQRTILDKVKDEQLIFIIPPLPIIYSIDCCLSS